MDGRHIRFNEELEVVGRCDVARTSSGRGRQPEAGVEMGALLVKYSNC